MSIALDVQPHLGAVRRSGIQVVLLPLRTIPLLRTAQGFHCVPVYKHLTPSGVKNRTRTMNFGSQRLASFNVFWLRAS